MDVIQSSFLEILRCAMAGAPVRDMEELAEPDWVQVAELAALHKVLPLVSDAVYQHPLAASVFEPLRSGIRRQVMLQTLRTHGFLELNRKLRAAGVKALVVKGIVCRSLYPKGDLRLSADEDLLVAPGHLEQAKAVLEEMGLTTAETAPDAHEYPYRDVNGPLFIELHAQLFPPGAAAYGDWNGYFREVFCRAEEMEIHGETVLTMAPTDHMLYLILHAFKHFLHSGVGVRQICDVVRCAGTWGRRVDWRYVSDRCREIRADGFLRAVLAIGEKHLGLAPDGAGIPGTWTENAEEAPLLEDALCGGVYGDSSRSRKQSSNMTLEAVAAEKQGRAKDSGILGSLFPAAEKLEGRYPYLKKQPYLLPVAWADRIIHYAGELGKDPGRAAESVTIGTQRLQLLRKYGVID